MIQIKNNNIPFLLYISLFSVLLLSCYRYGDEYDDPCDRRMPPPSGTNYITFMKTNGDTLQHIDVEKTDVPCKITASDYYDFKTRITFEYNTYDYYDTGYYNVEPLFNGELTFTVYFDIYDSINNGNFQISHMNIYFNNSGYFGYENIGDTKLTITKFGDVFDKVEGSFSGTFVNYNNVEDSLYVNCRFSAIHWCY